MRYRTKFPWDGLVWAALVLFIAVPMVSLPHNASSNVRFYCVLCIVMAAARILPWLFQWWEALPEGLRERSLWRVRIIPWQQLTKVTLWPEDKPARGFAVNFACPAPLLQKGPVFARPQDRQGFLDDLRRHAPQVDLDLQSSSSATANRGSRIIVQILFWLLILVALTILFRIFN